MAAAIKGLLDFIGYPVGKPPVAGPAFVGLLDFTGVPVGVGAGGPPAIKRRLLGLLKVGQ